MPDLIHILNMIKGKGNLEIKVFANNDTVPVSNSKLSSSEKYEVNFVPLTDVDHRVEIEFNKDKVSGSPFIVQVEHGKNGLAYVLIRLYNVFTLVVLRMIDILCCISR